MINILDGLNTEDTTLNDKYGGKVIGWIISFVFGVFTTLIIISRLYGWI